MDIDDSMPTTIVVLGWWSDNQQRITFIRLLRHALGMKLNAAKDLLDRQLESAQPMLLEINGRKTALQLATQIMECGAEVRVLHGSVRAGDNVATDELDTLTHELRRIVFSVTMSPEEKMRAAASIHTDLSVIRA